MSTAPPLGRSRRSLRDTVRAFGRAHRKAKAQLDNSMPLLEHLEDLRQRIFKAVAALVIAILISFVFAGQLVDFLAAPIGGRKLFNLHPSTRRLMSWLSQARRTPVQTNTDRASRALR